MTKPSAERKKENKRKEETKSIENKTPKVQRIKNSKLQSFDS